MANPFRLPPLKKIKNLDIDSEDRQAGLPSTPKLPSDTALSLHSLFRPTPEEDTPPTPGATSPRQARFKRLIGLLGPKKA